MFTQILIFLLGCLITLLINHLYYKKATTEAAEHKRIIDKLPDKVVEKLKKDTRPNLTVKELNELISIKTRDFSKEGLDSYIACPSCGGELIKGTELIDVDVDVEPGESYSYYPIYAPMIKCKNCSWKLNEFEANIVDNKCEI